MDIQWYVRQIYDVGGQVQKVKPKRMKITHLFQKEGFYFVPP